MIKKSFHFYIDVVGTCNLMCPSCPVGNSPEVSGKRGVMTELLLDQILAKATGECAVSCVDLFNWTEPLLNPKLPKLIDVVNSYNVPCGISTNLNIIKQVDLDELLATNVSGIRISVSGFSQSIYGVTHKGGDIEQVKRNMLMLAESKQRTNSATRISVAYIRYLNNYVDEKLMEKYAHELGFEFTPTWAFMMPLEKVLDYVDGQSPLHEADRKVLSNLALPLPEALEAAKKHKDTPCTLLNDQITLDVAGDVQLCCAVYDGDKYKVANYLNTPLEEIQKIKENFSICRTCTKHGLHVYYTHTSSELSDIAHQKRQAFEKEKNLFLGGDITNGG